MEGKERVSIIQGLKPVILVCPHGADDCNTDIITEACAKMLDCYAVINRGFERADVVDVLNDKADCNRVDHCTDEIVFEEYTDQILRFKRRCEISHPRDNVFIYHIHGFGKQVEQQAGTNIDIILGYGESEKYNSYTCELWHRNLFVNCWRHLVGGEVYVGKGGGKYAARHANNMNQYFRKHVPDRNTMSMQVEISGRLRDTETRAEVTGQNLCAILQTILNSDSCYIDVDVIGI